MFMTTNEMMKMPIGLLAPDLVTELVSKFALAEGGRPGGGKW